MLQKPDIKNDTLLLENKSEFPYFSNFLNRRMNYLLTTNEENNNKPNFNSNLGGGVSNLSTNINPNNKNITNPEVKPKKRNSKYLKEPELKALHTKYLKEPELKALKEPEKKNSKASELIFDEQGHLMDEGSAPINDFDPLKPLYPMKNQFWEAKDKGIPSREFHVRDESGNKKEDDKIEKAETICKEIALLAKEILIKINEDKICVNSHMEILNFQNILEKINVILLSRNQNEEINLEVFEKIEDFLKINGKITGYEICKYRFCENFLEFMFEGTLPTIYEITQGNKNKSEVDSYLDYDDEEVKFNQKEKKEISPESQLSIMKRIIAFYIYFSKHSINDSKGFL